MPFLNNAPSTSLHSTVARPKSEPLKRGREESVSPNVSRSRSVPNIDNAKKDVDDTDSNSDDDFVDKNHNSKKVKVEESDDEEDDLPDPDDLLEEIDLNTWRLMEIESIKTKFEGNLADRTRTQVNRMTHTKIREYLDKMTAVMEMKEIPKEMKLKDYVIRLDPPTDNKEYNSLMDNVEKQRQKRHDCTVPLCCPVQKCASSFLHPAELMRHIYQTYGIPWVNASGILVDLSVDLTRFADILEIARLLDADIVRACENTKDIEKKTWVEGCGSARQERTKGHRMRSDLAFSLGLHGVSLVVAFQLKSFVRLYFDAVKIMATDESKYFLQDYNEHIKSTLEQVMDHPSMPAKTRQHVQLTGESFNLQNSQ